MSQNDNKKSNKGLAAAGLVVAAAAGAIYLYGKKGEKRRQDLRGWMLKAKGEVMERLADLETVTEEKYHEIIDKALGQYEGAKRASAPEISRLRKELKEQWSVIKSEVSEHADSAKKEIASEKEEVEEAADNTSDTIKSVVTGAIIGAAREIASEKLSSKEHSTKETLKEVAKSAGKGALAGAAKQQVQDTVESDDEDEA